MKVVGMDPSMSNWGFALAELDLDTLEYRIEELLLVQTESGKKNKQIRVSSNDLERSRTLNEAYERMVSKAEMAFVEIPHGAQSARGALSNGMCIGILGKCQIPLIQLSESELKIATLGRKSGTKAEAINWATTKHPYAPWLRKYGKSTGAFIGDNEHLADAVAAIEAGIRSDQFKNALAILRFAAKRA